MARTVSTGWRSVTPGRCGDCGEDDDWDCDGRGTVYCSCQCCAECGQFDGHSPGCPTLATHDCTRCFRHIAAGREVEAFGVLYHEACAPKRRKGGRSVSEKPRV